MPNTIMIYQIDAFNVFTGQTQEISVMAGVEHGWVFDGPPNIPEGKVAKRSGPDWEICDPLPAPVPAPAPVPQTITPLQARKQLRIEGLKSAVDSYVLTLSEEAREEWEYCVTVSRVNGFVVDAARAMNKNEDWLDEFFRNASKIV